jgi:glutaredoxin
MNKEINITVYRWAGSWGPFSIKIPCGECSLTKDVIQDTIDNELKGIPIKLEIKEWLSEWWKPLRKAGWHAPIVLVENKIISQGAALNRGVLTQAVVEFFSKNSGVQKNCLFGKKTCPHCVRAKQYLEEAGIEYSYQDVVKNPAAMYEMLARVKPIVGPKTPITVPQIWIKGQYVGGADALSKIIHKAVEPNPDRGQCSLSKDGMSK